MVDIKGIKNLFNMSKGYFLTTIINQAIPFLLLPVLTRYLSTEEYGNVSLFNFYLMICIALVGSSIPSVVSKYFYEKDKNYISDLVGNCIMTSFLLMLIVEVVIVVMYHWVDDYLSIPLLWMLLLPPGAFAFVILSLGLTVCRNSHKVFHFGCHQVANTAVNLIISLLLICVSGLGWIGRAIGMLGAYFFSAIVMLTYLRRNGYLKWNYQRSMQKEIRQVIIPLIPNSLQMTIISQVGLFFMQLYFSKEMLGLYALGYQIAFCVKLLVDTIAMSWSPFLFQQISNKEEMNKLYVTRLLLVLFFGLLLGAGAVWVLTKPVLVLMTTPAFYGAKQFVPWFALGMAVYGMYAFLSPILIKTDQQRFIGGVSLVSMIIMIVANVLFARWFGYMGIVYAYCFSYVFLSLTLMIRVQKVFPLPWLKAVKIW